MINDGDLSYAKVRLDERSWEAVTAGLSTVEDQLTRALLWNTARDMVRDGDLSPADFLALVETHLPAEPVVAVVEAVLDVARLEIADHYLPPDRRPATVAALAEVCRRILRLAETDGVRLAALRGLIECSSTPEELAGLRSWLEADRVLPDGPDLDQELRWKALLQLSALGEAGEPEIAAELTRDPSATGSQGAARCRAALPDPVAKERAWQRLFTDDALSNHLLTATAAGFWQPCGPGVDRRLRPALLRGDPGGREAGADGGDGPGPGALPLARGHPGDRTGGRALPRRGPHAGIAPGPHGPVRRSTPRRTHPRRLIRSRKYGGARGRGFLPLEAAPASARLPARPGWLMSGSRDLGPRTASG